MNTNWASRFAARTKCFKASSIRELLKLTTNPEIISFAGGLPATETFPTREIKEACNTILSKNCERALQYGPTEGYTQLREHIAAMYREQGVPVSIDNVMVTTGSQQGLDLIGRTLIDPDDPVMVESPTYIGALQAWRTSRPRFVGVPIDANGMQVEKLEFDAPIKFLYSLPNFQNPTGVSLSLSRRHMLVDCAHGCDFVIVEDDPYRALRYSGEDLPSLLQIEAEMFGEDWDDKGRVIHLGTFSKVLAPGLRVGWVIAPKPVLRMLTLAKQGIDLHSAMLSQYIADELLQNGVIEGNYPHLVSIYRERRNTMLEALDEFIGDAGTWTRPQGGLFIWLTLKGFNTRELLGRALEHKVAFVPGGDFFYDDQGAESMRLNFSCMPPARIHEGIARLGHLIAGDLHHEQEEFEAVH